MQSMREIKDIKEIQKIELNILKYFKSVCVANGLRYYMAFGTLIGCVRHKGFIPWDDDIDVFMPYSDYLKLVQIFKNSDQKKYKLVSYETDDRYTAALPKIIDTDTHLIQNYGFVEKVELGLYIDIFPLAGTGNDLNEVRHNLMEQKKIADQWCRADTAMFVPRDSWKIKGLLRWFRNLPCKMKGYRYYIKQINQYMYGHSFDDYKFVTRFGLPFEDFYDYLWKKEDFGEGVELEFEGDTYCVPQNYDHLLTQMYGDYMKLPPKEKQVTIHDSKMYIKG